MSGNGNELKKKVKEWLKRGDEDLLLARHAFELESASPYRLIAYHAQQCAEKSLKAYLVFKNIDFPYTHNIKHLLELLPPAATWAIKLRSATILGSYAITTRSPGRDRVTKKEALQAVTLAATVQAAVIKVLVKEGLKASIRSRAREKEQGKKGSAPPI